MAHAEARRQFEEQSSGGATTDPDGDDVQLEPPSLSPEEIDALAQELSRIIESPGFFAAGDLPGVPLEREVGRLMANSERTGDQARRMNRLILEGLHRQTLKKLYVAGWRPMMFLYGGLGIFVAAIIWWVTRDVPRDHPRCNEAEIKLIEVGRPMSPTG